MKTFLRGISVAGAALAAAAPLSVFAVETSFLGQTSGLGGTALLFNGVLTWAVPTLIACAVVYFLYGVLMYVIMGDDEEKKEKAKSTILYGIVGIFVMVSVYGLVRLVQSTFGVGINDRAITPPDLSGVINGGTN